MYTFVHRTVKLSIAAGLLLVATSSFAYEGKKDAIDGGMTYPTKDGKYTAYDVNDQKVGPISYGRKATAGELKAWDTDIRADGLGLPEGKGSVEDGDELYEKHCVLCHGDFGAGGKGYPTLTNTDIESLKNQREYGKTDAPHRAIGSYWPKVSTLLWYIKDAMPYAVNTKALTEDETYAITAYLLAANEIKVDGKELDDEFVLSKDNILKTEMPNKDGFIPNIDGPDGPKNVKAFLSDGKNFGAIGKRCMKDCKDPGGTGKEAVAVFISDPRTDVTPAFAEDKTLPAAKTGDTKPGQADYEASCAACHGNDQMGAPDLGNKEAWAKVMEKGMDKVVAAAVKGKGAMPPKGGTDFSDDKLKTIIEYMYSQSK
jgi:cytochrome c